MQIDLRNPRKEVVLQFPNAYLVQKGRRIGKRSNSEEQHSVDKEKWQACDLCTIQSQTRIDDISTW